MHASRVSKIRSHLKKQKIDAVLISSVSNITYLTGYANFSKEEREAYLLINDDFQYIITDGRYAEAVKKQIPHFKFFERSYQTSTDKLFKDLKKKIKILGIEEDELTVGEYKSLKRYFKRIKHLNVSTHRSIKNLDEITKIAQAAKLGDQTFTYILKKIKPGISEKELAFEMEYFIKKQGAELSFPSIVAFGRNSSVPHHQTGNTVLANGESRFILLDFGVKLATYCSDMTRTIFYGKPTDKQRKIYEIVLTAQQKAIDYISSAMKSGADIQASAVDQVAREYIISKKYPTMPHSLGHGIGLEVHEYPSLSPHSKDLLQTGMVFSIEPGIYLPNFGGVRIEDLFVIQKNTLNQLTHSPKKLIVIR